MNSQLKKAILAITLISAGTISTTHTISSKKVLAGFGATASFIGGGLCYTAGSIAGGATVFNAILGRTQFIPRPFSTACGLYMLGTGCFYGTFKCLEYLSKPDAPAE